MYYTQNSKEVKELLLDVLQEAVDIKGDGDISAVDRDVLVDTMKDKLKYYREGYSGDLRQLYDKAISCLSNSKFMSNIFLTYYGLESNPYTKDSKEFKDFVLNEWNNCYDLRESFEDNMLALKYTFDYTNNRSTNSDAIFLAQLALKTLEEDPDYIKSLLPISNKKESEKLIEITEADLLKSGIKIKKESEGDNLFPNDHGGAWSFYIDGFFANKSHTEDCFSGTDWFVSPDGKQVSLWKKGKFIGLVDLNNIYIEKRNEGFILRAFDAIDNNFLNLKI